jgi:hypothetical protein
MVCPCSKPNGVSKGGAKCVTKGGANQAPLSYVNRGYQEPSAFEGVNKLGSETMLARPVLNPTGGRRTKRSNHSRKNRRNTRRKGGFYPSAMGSLINNGSKLIPAAGVQAYRMLRNYKSRKNRK